MSSEDTTKKMWDKLENLYQSKYLVNKLFLQKKLYLLSLNDGDSVIEHLDAFSVVISQIVRGYQNRRGGNMYRYVMFFP